LGEEKMIKRQLFFNFFKILPACFILLCAGGCSNDSQQSDPLTRLIIPDKYNSRIVSITGMNPSADQWIEVSASDLNYTSDDQFRPNDVDYDSSGRIYILNSRYDEESIICYDNISDTTGELIITGLHVQALAIDKTSDIMYFSTRESPSKIYRKNLSSTDAATALSINPGDRLFQGVFPDGEGNLFAAHESSATSGYCKINISDGAILKEALVDDEYRVFDITVKNGNVYGTVFETQYTPPRDYTRNLIIRYDINLENRKDIHKSSVSDTHLYGPHYFVTSTDEKRLYVIDENYFKIYPSDLDENEMNRIVAINAVREDEDWEIFNSSMIDSDPPKDPFKFYLSC